MATPNALLDNPGVTPEDALSLGWSIIPCNADKKPRGFWRQWQTERPDAAKLAEWREADPAAWAVVTGEVSGVVVLDFDGTDGLETLRRLGLAAHVQTGSGGAHVYVKHPGWRVATTTKAKRKLAAAFPGLDIKGDGGYAIFSGATAAGSYTWLRPFEPVPFESLPEALQTFLRPAEAPRKPAARETRASAANGPYSPTNAVNTAIRRVTDENALRNETGFWLAGQLRDLQLEKGEAQPFMLEFHAAVTVAGDHEYAESEALASLESAFSRPAREYPEPASVLPDENALAGAIGTPVWALDAGAAEFLIDPFIELGTVTMLTGPPAAGKSFLSLAIATSLIHGEPFAGFPTRPARVLYVDRENPPKRIQERLAAVGFKPRRGDERRFVYWGPWAPEVPEGPESKRILAWVKANAGCLVVFDSYVRFFRGKEADPNDTAKFFGLIDRLKADGATVLILHHTGKAETAQDYRGSSDLLAAVDAMYRVKATYRTEPDPERPWRSRKVLATLTLKETKTRSGYEAEPTLRFVAGVGFVQDGGATTEDGAPDPITDFVHERGEATRAEIVEKFGERAYKKWKEHLPETVERAGTKNGNLPGSAVYRLSKRGS